MFSLQLTPKLGRTKPLTGPRVGHSCSRKLLNASHVVFRLALWLQWLPTRVLRSLANQAFYCKHPRFAWAYAEGGKRPSAPSWKLGLRSKIFHKPEVSNLIPIYLFNSCNDILFTGITLALHTSQVHCSGVMQWWACVRSFPGKIGLRGLRADCSWLQSNACPV